MVNIQSKNIKNVDYWEKEVLQIAILPKIPKLKEKQQQKLFKKIY
jgi:hypothetical protein